MTKDFKLNKLLHEMYITNVNDLNQNGVTYITIENTSTNFREELVELFGRISDDSFAAIYIPYSKFRGTKRKNYIDYFSRVVYLSGFSLVYFYQIKNKKFALIQKKQNLNPDLRSLKVTAIVAVYNEASTVGEVIEQLLLQKINGASLDIIIVESNSSDGSREKILEFSSHQNVSVILQERASGKGSAIREALATCVSDFVIFQDADLEYEISDYTLLLAPLIEGSASLVLGSRTKNAKSLFGVRHFEGSSHMSFLLNLGNVFFKILFNKTYRAKLSDPFTMYKVFRRDVIHGMKFSADRFDFDWEILGKLIRRGYVPTEIPITYNSRSFSEGKKVNLFSDPITWIIACFKYRFEKIN